MMHFIDLNAHELSRQAAVLAACGDLYDPVLVAGEEAEAREVLYSDLSPAQESLRVQLIDAGVLDA